MNRPLVSVCCITYNHSKFIAECLKGFLSQITNFEVEYIVHDDASTDDTQKIIREAVGTNSSFKLILRENNIKSTGQAIFPLLFKEAQGKYIAMCEGDDYWTDPLKLQKQVDFLEANPDFAVCGSLATRSYDNPSTPNDIEGEAGVFEQKDLAQRNFIPTATVVFRSTYIKDYPMWVSNCAVGDWPLFLICSNHGQIKILENQMALRRVHAGGVWGANINSNNSVKNVLRLYDMFDILKDKFSEEVNTILYENYLNQLIKLVDLNLKLHRFNEVSKYLQILVNQGCNRSQQTESLTTEIAKKLTLQEQEINDLKTFNVKLMNSNAYKLGRRFTGLFKFLKQR